MQPNWEGPSAPRPALTSEPLSSSSVRSRLTVSYGESVEGDAAPLAAVVHSDGAAAPAGAALVVRVALPQLAGDAAAELWHTSHQEVETGTRGNLRWAAAGDVLFGALEQAVGDGPNLEAATGFAYRELLGGAEALGFPHLLRTWNVVPGINEIDGDLERYRFFCRGRADAFEGHYGPCFQPLLPASSAVGSERGAETPDQLVVWFLACRDRGTHRENPRQVSAYCYPPLYGPRSPSFARATLGPAAAGDLLLLSGTASIVGHRSVHLGDVMRQLEETMLNLGVLLTPGSDAAVPFRALKVYLRHAEHVGPVREALEQRLPDVPVLYLRADICRQELLVEVEGVA